MSDMERLHKIIFMMQKQGYVSREEFLSELEISPATFKRDIAYLRDRNRVPITWSAFDNGYFIEGDHKEALKHVPGLWFSQSEATALALMEHYLASLDKSGLLGPHIEPLRAVIDNILGPDTSSQELRKRIKVLGMFTRNSSMDCFGEIGNALLNRKRLQITFYSKAKDELTEREISAQRLIYYRDNWYLDAFCHLRNDLRSFAVDGLKNAVILPKSKAIEVDDQELQANFAQSYGIFSGRAVHQVKLKFNPQRARWVATELWHPDQKGSTLPDGSYVLEFPYNQDHELLMDIMKHGSAVEVLEPPELRDKLIAEVHQNLALYR
jgi:predicted DNA-binding transcriptional regulator YafY